MIFSGKNKIQVNFQVPEENTLTRYRIVVNVTRLQTMQGKVQRGTNSWSFRREGSVKGTRGQSGRFCVQGEFCVPKVRDCSIAIDQFFRFSR